MIRLQMQQLTEENQKLNNKILNLKEKKERLYQDLASKIEVLQNNLEKNTKLPSESIIPKEETVLKKNIS